MGRWRDLPAEIRLTILEIVAEDYSLKSEPYAIAGYASVCREWQPVFEQKNFQRIVLDQERISDLEQFMAKSANKKRQRHLKHLFLRVRLNEYDCIVCQSKEDEETIKTNDDIFSRAVWKLLIILSKWTVFPQVCGPGSRQKGLRLELGAYSPSDSKHTFRDFHLEHGYPYQESIDLEIHLEAYKLRTELLGLYSLNDPYHGWVDGHRDIVSLESKQRIMGTLSINFNLPEASEFLHLQTFRRVEIVEGLLIRRHFYRRIAVSCLDYKSLILCNLPSTLRGLHIFEDFNKHLHPERSAKLANLSLGKALSKSDHFLESLSAAFLVDAEDFFARFRPTRPQNSSIIPWENLRTLALTSRLLHPKIGRGRINKLLKAAGRAAAVMPQLEIMEIWNGGEGHACIFRYSNSTGKPRNPWAINWGIEMQLNDKVLECWANLPKHGQNPYSNFTIEVNRLPKKPKRVKTYAVAISYLKLRGSVLDLISDYQLFWEEYSEYNLSRR